MRNSAYFPALTGVRALAAWMVFFYHFNPFPAGGGGWRLVQEGHIGVMVFFVLSGLLICARYLGQVEYTRKWAARYLRNRVARIYPMYFLVTCVTCAVMQMAPAYDEAGLWKGYNALDHVLILGLNLTFLRGFFDQFKFTGIAAGWTLTVEECFYLAAPLLLFGLRRAPWRLAVAAILFIVIGTALVLVAPHNYGFFKSLAFMFQFTFFGRCLEFLAGMALALLILSKIRLPGQFYTWGGLAWIGVVVCFMAWVDDPTLSGAQTELPHLLLNNVVIVPGACALFYGLIYEQTWLRRLLETKVFDLLGKASYTFYLIHLGILSQFLHLHVTGNVLVMFFITNVLAIALFKWVEEPLHRWIAGRRKPIVVAEVPVSATM